MKDKIQIYILCFIFLILLVLNQKNIKNYQNLTIKIQQTDLQLQSIPILTNTDGELLIGKKFPHFKLTTLNNDSLYYPNGFRKNLYLFVIFSPLDCKTCLNEAHYWNSIYTRYAPHGLNVIGIGVHKRKWELMVYKNNEQIRFPICFDKNNEISSRLKIDKTPIKLLVNGNSEIVYAQYANNVSSHVNKLIQEIATFIHI